MDSKLFVAQSRHKSSSLSDSRLRLAKQQSWPDVSPSWSSYSSPTAGQPFTPRLGGGDEKRLGEYSTRFVDTVPLSLSATPAAARPCRFVNEAYGEATRGILVSLPPRDLPAGLSANCTAHITHLAESVTARPASERRQSVSSPPPPPSLPTSAGRRISPVARRQSAGKGGGGNLSSTLFNLWIILALMWAREREGKDCSGLLSPFPSDQRGGWHYNFEQFVVRFPPFCKKFSRWYLSCFFAGIGFQSYASFLTVCVVER